MIQAPRRQFLRVLFVLIVGVLVVALPGCGTNSPFTPRFATPNPLQSGTKNEPYILNGTNSAPVTIRAAGVTGPPTGVYTYTLVAGSLPPGLTMTTVNTIGTNDTSVAQIKGTPTASGTFTFTVKVTDTETPAHSATMVYNLTIVN